MAKNEHWMTAYSIEHILPDIVFAGKNGAGSGRYPSWYIKRGQVKRIKASAALRY